jgi:hypothetical protein
MNVGYKKVEELSPKDLEKYAIWQYVSSEEIEDVVVKPIIRIPVKDLKNKLVGTKIGLANGDQVWGLIGNCNVSNPLFTEHFITISILKNEKWFVLARYHDFDYLDHGPKALAEFLDLNVDSVFPITYDISRYVKDESSALSGQILKEPREKLTRAEIIALAIPKPLG